MGRNRDVKLCWVEYAGVIRHVSEFAPVDPGQRPLVTCPVCKREVTLKLGPKVTHHCAHRPGDECAVSSGETALHLNCKLHIFHELSRARELRIARACTAINELPYNGQCEETGIVVWLRDWDRAEVECKVGTIRPDITLFRGDAPVGAIEVFATHAVDAAKEELLKGLNVPWLEVRADEALYAGTTPWSSSAPLPILRECPRVERCCDAHQAALARAEHARKNRTLPFLQRIGDLYFPSGKRFRDVYTMYVRLKDGNAEEAWLERSGESDRYGVHKEPSPKKTWQLLNGAFAELAERHAQRGVVLDSPMAWVPGKPRLSREQWFLYDPGYFRPRYAWHKQDRVWFLPYDERERTWDTVAKDVQATLSSRGSIPRPHRPGRRWSRRRYFVS